MQLPVFNIEGQETKAKVTLPEGVFGIEPNDHAIYLDVKQYLANQRQGTHKSKERWEIAGSTRKLHKQKGTGGARKGDINSPLLKGGARVFGPQPRDYSFKLNKKVKVLARKSALAYKAQGNNITVVEDFTFDAPKTKAFAAMLKSFNVTGQRVLLVTGEKNDNIVLSGRNLQKTKIVVAGDLNTYDVMNASKVLLLNSAIVKIEETLNK
ncbi:MAG: 50S ribosomal protein L4 [Sphingobacteriaceae bacterium]|jgi:large subunit ribosomal protein L4|nr:50S ribosomal protein L4 [Sphingobacteriaceae bacterium]